MLIPKKYIAVLSLVVLACLVMTMFSGCGGEKTPAVAETNDGLPEVHWTMTTSWSEGMSLQKWAKEFAGEIEKMSGGKFTIDVQPGGAIVGAMEALDAVDKGTVEIMHSCANYWMGKHPASGFFSSVIMCFEPLAHLTWIYEGGGLELWQRMYQEEMGLNVISFPAGAHGPDLLAWTNKPLDKLEDWKGLKFRTISWWGEILKSIGVSVVSVPGAEIYSAMERGVVDAVEYDSPTTDYDLKFYEVSDYYAGPGVHQPSMITEIGINKDEWDKLPAQYQAMIETACRSVTLWALCSDYNTSIEALEFYDKEGVQRNKLEESEQHRVRELGWAFIDEQAKNDEFLKEVWDSARAYYLRFSDYEEFMHPVKPEPGTYE